MSIHRRRRQFLQTGLTGSLAIGVDAVCPRYLLQAASAEQTTDSVLVVVQLSGGNDGLNTVIPFRDDEYYKARPTLAIGKDDLFKIEDDCGLHPSLRGVAELYDDGLLTIVQGVGYDNPNRSHFESMDIWHSCQRKNEKRTRGWLGRFLDHEDAATAGNSGGGAVSALHFGQNQQPLALQSENVRVPSVRSLDEFRLKSQRAAAFRALVEQLTAAPEPAASANELLSFVRSTTSSALVASQQVEEARRSHSTAIPYPESELAHKLSIIAQLIDSGLETRIYYVELDGFDTHARQADTHAILLRQWSEAITAFVRDLQDHGHLHRVCVMSFSEFGRRVHENASEGTDHGAAAPMIFAGGNGGYTGLVGPMPDLLDLRDGDLSYAIDFRQVYTTVLREWLGTEPAAIVGADFDSLPLFSKRV